MEDSYVCRVDIVYVNDGVEIECLNVSSSQKRLGVFARWDVVDICCWFRRVIFEVWGKPRAIETDFLVPMIKIMFLLDVICLRPRMELFRGPRLCYVGDDEGYLSDDEELPGLV